MNSAAPALIEKRIVLVGAGNAHLVFLRRFRMKPMAGVAVTLVNEAAVVPYSAMVPGCLAGHYERSEISIDLVRLCASVGVRHIAERATRIDPRMRQVQFADRPALTYDALSLGLGSLPACPVKLDASVRSLPMRPLAGLLRSVTELEEQLRQVPRPFHLVVVGGGASGCELALAVHQRLKELPDFRVTLLQANARLLPLFPSAAARAFQSAFDRRTIDVRLSTRVIGGEDGFLICEDGHRLTCDAVLWATPAAPPPLMRDSGLVLDDNGFLRVRDTLQSESDSAIFGTGDCVSFRTHPDLPKNGVHAVREGAVLFDNLQRFLHEQPLKPYRPQKFCLTLLNTADGDAVLTYGPLALKGRWARKLKDRIDRRWIDKFTRLAPMTPADGNAEAPLMRCGGCGSKVSGDVLSAVLRRLDIPADPRILLGCRDGEDAAVHRVRPELFSSTPEKLVEVQTVDFFKAFVDDPYLFGRIAALNAVSDLYAMNARPFTALAIATLPYARGPVQEAMLFELLSGALHSFRELGVVLTGGHTTEGGELALGFAVTGHAEEGRLFQKSALRPNDVLILTKPLGSGALLAAWMRGQCRAPWFAELTRLMCLSNGPAGAIFDRAGVTACTDVTGFGLAGHLLEMLDASQVSAALTSAQVPRYAGFGEVVAEGIVSSLQGDNAKVGCRVQSAAPAPEWLFDPQTSGGLLAAVQPTAVEETLRQLRAAGYVSAAVIGRIEPTAADVGPTIYLD